MRAGQAALIIVGIVLPVLVRAQSGTETKTVIPVHPRVPTIVKLPDPIEDAWITDSDDFRLAIVGKQLYVRPRPGTPAGVEETIEVKTATLGWTFRVRVVARARDATPDVVVLPSDGEPDIEEWTPRIEEDVIEEGAIEEAPPATSEPANAPAEAEGAGEPAEAATEHQDAVHTSQDDTPVRPPHFELSAHLVVDLGVTALDLAGYEPRAGWQHHQALGLRLTGVPHGRWWGLELDVSAERLAGPLTYDLDRDSSRHELSGPWLRAMLGTRAWLDASKWIPTGYVGIGAQAHLRGTQTVGTRGDSSTMLFGGVLALGMGVQYRARDIRLGVEFRVWHGGPDEYRSIAGLFTVGRVLDQGDAP